MRRLPALHSIIAAVIIAVTLLACTLILTRGLVRVKSKDEFIRITGSAQQPIRSDFIIWTGEVSRTDKDRATAYRLLKSDMDKVQAYLVAKGVPPTEITVAAIATKTLYVKSKPTPPGYAPPADSGDENSAIFQPVAGYRLTEDIEVHSHSVELVDDLARRSTELLSQGISLESQPPQYLYTKLSDLKVSMLSEAAKDARARADQIAASSGCRVGALRYARMGVLQIVPLYPKGNEAELSSTGENDTSSLDKRIIAIVTARFSIRE